MDNIRKQIRNLIAANTHTLVGNLNRVFTRTAEDLIAGGARRAELAESLFTVGLTYKLAVEGKQQMVAHLRELADFLERMPVEKPSNGRPN